MRFRIYEIKGKRYNWNGKFFVALAGLVAVHGDWDKNKVYKYEVKVKAFKYPDQWRNDPSGLYSRHHLTLRPYSDDVVIGQITQAEFVKGKPQRDNQDDSRSDNQDYADADDGSFNATPLSKPFKINLRNGVIQSLGVHNSMTTFEVNQLRLIVNQFQVDRNGQNVNSRSENRLPQAGSNAAFYKTMESNENCETVYDISPIPDYLAKSHPDWIPMPEINESNGEYIEIVKTKNSADCNGRRNVLSAASNYLSENGVSESDLSIVEKQRIVVSGSVHRFTIQSAISAIKLMHNRNRDIPLISVYVNATLESVESADRQSANLPDSLKIVQNLNYDFNPKMDEYQPIQPRQCE